MLTIVASVGFVGYLSLFFEVGTAIKGLPTVAVVKNGDAFGWLRLRFLDPTTWLTIYPISET